MEDNLIEILLTFGYEVCRQGSMSDDEEYPETFFTFWNNNSPDHAHYDNDEYGTSWDFDVNVYSSDPALTYSVLADARAALKAAGWIIPGKGYDVASDVATHTGRGMNALYLEV
jgi:hypothetical protein